MGAFSYWHWIIVLLIVVVIMVLPQRRPGGRPRDAGAHPVFSAVSTQGQEVERIDERLPRRPWRMLALMLAVALVAAIGGFALRHFGLPFLN
ncbi:MAG: hypothetical protein JNJ71_00935 [Rubrivivax sp.]|nr:hypothetical protein [Rubrivivax sp.]